MCNQAQIQICWSHCWLLHSKQTDCHQVKATRVLNIQWLQHIQILAWLHKKKGQGNLPRLIQRRVIHGYFHSTATLSCISFTDSGEFLHLRHTLVGITLDICNKDLPRVTTSLLSEPVLNWVIAIMEERCRECGIMNDDPGATMNHYPWIAAIKEKAFNVDGKSSKTSSTATQHVTNFLHF